MLEDTIHLRQLMFVRVMPLVKTSIEKLKASFLIFHYSCMKEFTRYRKVLRIPVVAPQDHLLVMNIITLIRLELMVVQLGMS